MPQFWMSSSSSFVIVWKIKIQNTLFMVSGNGSMFVTVTQVQPAKFQVLCLLGRCNKTLVVDRRHFCLTKLNLGCNRFEIWLQTQAVESLGG